MRSLQFPILALAALACSIVLSEPVRAQTTLRLKNGYVLRGSASKLVGLNHNAFAAAAAGADPASLPIAVVDDGLRRTFVHNRGMVAEASETPDLIVRLDLWQQVARASREIASVSNLTQYSQFNEFGRRWATTPTPDGPLRVLQGITEINSRYVQIQGLQTEKGNTSWDMRVSTDSIPGETFARIFDKAIDREDLDGRLDVVRFFIDSERFGEAREELQAVIRDFPEADQLPKQLQALTQREAEQILAEAIVRRNAGQYSLASAMWQKFLNVDGIARVKKLEAQDRIAELNDTVAKADRLLEQLRTQVAELPAAEQGELAKFIETMSSEMTFDTLPRLSDYERLGSQQNLALSNRISLAIGGWILGAGSGLQNLAVARSLIRVRELVAEYLGPADPIRREAIIQELEKEEAAQPEYLAFLLKYLPPPLPLPIEDLANAAPNGDANEKAGDAENNKDNEPENGEDPADADEAEQDAVADENQPKTPPGFFDLEIDTAAGKSRYLVQLPPEYNPYRKYPAVVALHPLQAPPEAEIVWWAGAYSEELGMCAGQASRRGYVVIAPQWSREGQTKYEYTPIEHDRVLSALRDAMRRISIDSDRVFLAGHLAGASAAWDIAIAHPELWAGMVSIGGDAGKYISFYEENARYLPLYFVTGELAGTPSPLIRNGADYDKYMKFGYQAMITLYRGRGDEYFYEDINNIFDWMDLSSHTRSPIPKEIEAVTMRYGDNFFWWIEMSQILDTVAVNPILFDYVTTKRAAPVTGRVADNNTVIASRIPAKSYNILLSPEMGLNMREPITIRADGSSRVYQFEGKIRFMLEDARRRADRQHVYWDQVSS